MIVRFCGEVAEWLKALAWKASVRRNPYREFESHPLRQLLVGNMSHFNKLNEYDSVVPTK